MQRAAEVVHVVRVPVVRARRRDDCLERRRIHRRNLDGVEGAVGDSVHPHVAVAPGLSREPVDDEERVLVLTHRVFVVGYAFGPACSPHVHAKPRIVIAGIEGLEIEIAAQAIVILSIGEDLEDGRHAVCGRGSFGQEKRGRQVDAVRHSQTQEFEMNARDLDGQGDSGGNTDLASLNGAEAAGLFRREPGPGRPFAEKRRGESAADGKACLAQESASCRHTR